MTEARVKGEPWNKVKLRGQKIPDINRARKVSFLQGQFLCSDKGTKEGKRKKLEREGERPNPLLGRRVHLVNLPAPQAQGRQFHSDGDPPHNSRPGRLLPSQYKQLSRNDNWFVF